MNQPSATAAVIAIAAGYLVGSLPIAWLVVRRQHGLDLRRHGRGGTGALDALLVAGPRTAFNAVLLEVLKGAIVGVGARAYSDTGWFTAAAIAGCVAGDAFPLFLRRGGRGLVPLVSGLIVALPLAGLITGLAAFPAAGLTRMRGRAYDMAVLIAVPLGLVAGTDDLRTLAPAAAIVLVLLVRQHLRRAAAAGALPAPRDRPRVIDADPERRTPGPP